MSANPAAVNNRPLAALSDPNADGFHRAAAICFSVTRLIVQMLTGQTIGTMVSMVASCTAWNDQTVADLAGKAIITGMMAIIALHIFFSFIFSVQCIFLLKVIVILTLREVLRYLAYANLPVCYTLRFILHAKCSFRFYLSWFLYQIPFKLFHFVLPAKLIEFLMFNLTGV